MDGKWPRMKIQVLGFRAHAWEPEGLANLSPQNGGCYTSVIFFWPGGGGGGGGGLGYQIRGWPWQDKEMNLGVKLLTQVRSSSGRLPEA